MNYQTSNIRTKPNQFIDFFHPNETVLNDKKIILLKNPCKTVTWCHFQEILFDICIHCFLYGTIPLNELYFLEDIRVEHIIEVGLGSYPSIPAKDNGVKKEVKHPVSSLTLIKVAFLTLLYESGLKIWCSCSVFFPAGMKVINEDTP